VADIGDKISIRSKAGARLGVVTAVSGSMLRVRWDTGEETSIAPGPGVLTVIGGAAKTKSGKPSARRATTKKKTAAARAATKKAR
jgi:hypothetical protein